jgi:nucleotide-binding universal stress UspA family protein
MILIRAHNNRNFKNWMLGSVARAIVREATCSVEIVRAVKEDMQIAGNGHLRILLATDGSEHAVAAARAVAERQWPEGTEVKLMSMVSPLMYSIEEIGLFDGGRTERAHRAIADATQILQGAGLRTSGEVIAGRPVRRIAHEAKEWGADLIVVGTQDRRGIRRLISGSVSETVASRAPCSVKVVRAHAR